MFAGLLVNVDSLDDWISWVKYLSCIRYSLNVSNVAILSFYFVVVSLVQ